MKLKSVALALLFVSVSFGCDKETPPALTQEVSKPYVRLNGLDDLDDSNYLRTLFTRSMQNNDAQAQYHLFEIYKNGWCGMVKNPEVAIINGEKARNRPNPVPEIIMKLPYYIFDLYQEVKDKNSEKSRFYLTKLSNYRDWDDFDPNLIIDEYEMIGTRSDLKKITQSEQNFNTQVRENELGDDSFMLMVDKIYFTKINEVANVFIDGLLSPSSKTFQIVYNNNFRLVKDKILQEIKSSISIINSQKEYPFVLLRRLLPLVRSEKILKDFFKKFSEEIVPFRTLCSKMGVDALPDKYFSHKTSYTQIMSISQQVERSLLQKMADSFYWPAVCDKADMHQKHKEHQEALVYYLQAIKFFPYFVDIKSSIVQYLNSKNTPNLQYINKNIHDILNMLLESNCNILKFESLVFYSEIFIDKSLKKTISRKDFEYWEYCLDNMSKLNLDSSQELCMNNLHAQYYMFQGNYLKAYSYWEKCAKFKETPLILMNLGSILLKYLDQFPDKSIEDALNWYRRAHELGSRKAQSLLEKLDQMINNQILREKKTGDSFQDIPTKKPKQIKQKLKPTKTFSPKVQSEKDNKPQQPKASNFSEELTAETFEPSLPMVYDLPDDEIAELEKELLQNLNPWGVSLVEEVLESPTATVISQPLCQLPEEINSSVESLDQSWEKPTYPQKIKNPKTFRENMRKMAMLRRAQKEVSTITPASRIILQKEPLETLKKIFDLRKPTISDKEFSKFSIDPAFKGLINFFQTKSGFAMVANGKVFEEGENSAGTHWNHINRRDGLDCHFVADVRQILTNLDITPDTVG